jgi:TIR domain
MTHESIKAVEVFYSYAHKDEKLRNALMEHLSTLRQQGYISEWYDRQIVAGTDWAQEIDAHLTSASLILLLISPSFITSDYCYGIELKRP